MVFTNANNGALISGFLLCALLAATVTAAPRKTQDHGFEEEVESCANKLCTLDDSSLRFLVVGDWGGLKVKPYHTEIQKKVARGMAQISLLEKAHFIASVGDNFYLSGVKSTHDPRFRSTFENVYNFAGLFIPWYHIAGNHDHNGDVQAQIDYHGSKRWIFPNYYYKTSYQLQGDGPLVETIFLDTIVLCGNDIKNPTTGKTEIKGPADVIASENQWHWLHDQLKTSNADYLFVVGHYPIYSVGSHGSTDCLIKRLLPMMERYKVSTYFAGHDHNLQHFQTVDKDGTTILNHALSGAGAFMDTTAPGISKVPEDSLKFIHPHSSSNVFRKLFGKAGVPFPKKEDGGFVYVDVNAVQQFATVKFYDGSGKDVLHHYIVHSRNNPQSPGEFS